MGDLRVWQAELRWSCEELGGHQQALRIFVQVLAFVAELCEFREDDTSDEDLLGAEGIRQRWVGFEDLTELLDDVEALEYGIHAVVPASLCLSQVAISVEQVAQLMQSLDQQELLLALSQLLDAFLVVPYDHRRKYFMAFPFRPDFEVVLAFALLVGQQSLRVDSKLVVELAACL